MGRGPRFTNQYVGGILAGLGIGIVLGLALGLDARLPRWLVGWPLQVAAVSLLPIGQYLAWKGQATEESS